MRLQTSPVYMSSQYRGVNFIMKPMDLTKSIMVITLHNRTPLDVKHIAFNILDYQFKGRFLSVGMNVNIECGIDILLN